MEYLFFHDGTLYHGVLNVLLAFVYAMVAGAVLCAVSRMRADARRRRLDRDRGKIAALMRVRARKEALRFTGLTR